MFDIKERKLCFIKKIEINLLYTMSKSIDPGHKSRIEGHDLISWIIF